MKLKTGQKVKVKKHLVHLKDYGEAFFINQMSKYLGKTLTIKSEAEFGGYLVIENEWTWTKEMFEPLKPNKRGKNPRDPNTGRFKKRESVVFNGTCFIGIENPRLLDMPESLTQEEIKKLKNLLKGMENL